MSILIKGVEMPKDGCRDCIFVNRKWHGDVCPFLKIEVTGNVERGGFQTNCPLVPVSAHGDLIDRDALKVSIAFAEKTAEWAVPALRAVLMVIDEMPTIIPADDKDINVPNKEEGET